MLTNQTFIHLQRNRRNNLQFKQLLHIPPGASRFYIGHGLGAYSCAGLITAYRINTRPAWKTYNCYNTGMKNLTYNEMSPDKRQRKRPWGRRFLSWYIIVLLFSFFLCRLASSTFPHLLLRFNSLNIFLCFTFVRDYSTHALVNDKMYILQFVYSSMYASCVPANSPGFFVRCTNLSCLYNLRRLHHVLWKLNHFRLNVLKVLRDT